MDHAPGSLNLGVTKLRRSSNFQLWKMSAINDLRSIGIWKYLKPEGAVDIPAADAEEFEAYDKVDILAMRYFQKALEEDLQPMLLRCTTAKAMWENILYNFERKKFTTKTCELLHPADQPDQITKL